MANYESETVKNYMDIATELEDVCKNYVKNDCHLYPAGWEIVIKARRVPTELRSYRFSSNLLTLEESVDL